MISRCTDTPAGTPSAFTTIGVSQTSSTEPETSDTSTPTTDSTSLASEMTTTSSESNSESATSSSDLEETDKAKVGKGVIAGSAVGGAAALLLVIGMVWWFLKIRRKASPEPLTQEGDQPVNHAYGAPGSPGVWKVAELPAQYNAASAVSPQELPTAYNQAWRG